MESRSPGAGGGGGRDAARPPSPPASPPRADLRHDDRQRHHDDRRGDERPRPCPSSGPPAAPPLSLDQIRAGARRSNEYTDGPTLARKAPDPPAPDPPGPDPPGPDPLKDPVLLLATETPAAGPSHGPPLPILRCSLAPPPPCGGADEGPRGIAGGSSHEGSLSSLQRLMGSPRGGEEAVRAQPKRAELDGEELKPLAAAAAAGADEGPHSQRCSDCGRCGCGECTRPRLLPSCWLCGRRCVCSARRAAEYATCVCCVRGLFYHCSSDDEDTCAEKPFSCTQAHCGARWAAVALLAPLLPCIACYPLATACAAACQHCYDAAARPGCRCQGGARRRAGAKPA
ncbi:unnamed protein product [Lota lota]